MITTEQMMYALETLSSLALLWYLVGSLYPSFLIDDFRQRMFAIRDELYDYASNGNIGFEHPAYKLLRQSMNAFIRYGHKLTFGQVLLTVVEWQLLSDQPTLKGSEKLEHAIGNIPNVEVRERLERFHSRATNLAIRSLVLGSFTLMFVVGCLAIARSLTRGITNIKQLLSQSGISVIHKLVDPRLLEEEARRYPCESF